MCILLQSNLSHHYLVTSQVLFQHSLTQIRNWLSWKYHVSKWRVTREERGGSPFPLSFGNHGAGHFALYTICCFLSCFVLTLYVKEQTLWRWIESLYAWKTFLACCRHYCNINSHGLPEFPYHHRSFLQLSLFCSFVAGLQPSLNCFVLQTKRCNHKIWHMLHIPEDGSCWIRYFCWPHWRTACQDNLK